MLVLAHKTRWVCAPLRRQRLPARAAEDFLVALVGQLSVGDRDFAQQALQQRLLLRRRWWFSASSSISESTSESMRLMKKLATPPFFF